MNSVGAARPPACRRGPASDRFGESSDRLAAADRPAPTLEGGRGRVAHRTAVRKARITVHADHRPQPCRHPPAQRLLHLVTELAKLMASALGVG
jgi:hypothetical protein